jgi:putative endonuclease
MEGQVFESLSRYQRKSLSNTQAFSFLISYNMDYVVYILYSYKSKRNYTGFTSHLIERFYSHNFYGKDSTRLYRPWIVVHVEFYETKPEALTREKYYKAGRGSIKKNEIITQYIARWANTLP